MGWGIVFGDRMEYQIMFIKHYGVWGQGDYGLNQSLALCPLSSSGPFSVTNTTSSNLTPATPSIYTPIHQSHEIARERTWFRSKYIPSTQSNLCIPFIQIRSPPISNSYSVCTVHVLQCPIHVP